jgi:hypothetical protein
MPRSAGALRPRPGDFRQRRFTPVQPLDVDYTPQRRHQVVLVRWCTRAASAVRVLVGVVDVACLHRRRPGGHARVVLTQRAQQSALFSGRAPDVLAPLQLRDSQRIDTACVIA